MNMGKVELVLIAAIVFFVAANLLLLGGFITFPGSPSNVPDSNTLLDANESIPSVRLVSMIKPDCVKCFSLAGFGSLFEQQGFSVKEDQSVEFNSTEGSALISEFDLNRVPVLLISANQAASTQLSQSLVAVRSLDSGDTLFIVSDFPGAFFDLKNNRERGVVNVSVVFDSSCADCRPPVDQQGIENSGIAVGSFLSLDYNSQAGKDLLNQYKVQRLPVAIFSSELSAYPVVLENLQGIVSVESDGNFVMRDVPPVYWDLNSNRLVGLVDLTLLETSACTTCLDANNFIGLVNQAFGITPKNVTRLDVASVEGNALIKDLNIVNVPSFFLSGDVNAYPGLISAWSDIGFEKNGRFVFSNFSALGPGTVFFDLDQNKSLTVSSSEGNSE